VKNFKYSETLVTNQNFWLHPLSDQNLANYNTLTMKSKLIQFRKCLQKQQTFHRMCRNTAITTHKSVFLLFCLVTKFSLEGIWEQSAGENIWVCTDVTWAKTAQSCLWLCYRLDNPGLSFQQSQVGMKQSTHHLHLAHRLKMNRVISQYSSV